MGTCFGCKPGWTGTTCSTRMIGIKMFLYRCMQTSLDILGDVSGNKNRVNCLFKKEKCRGFHLKNRVFIFYSIYNFSNFINCCMTVRQIATKIDTEDP